LAKEISPPAPSQSSILGLDRKKMEEERLTRLASRKRLLDTDVTEIIAASEAAPKRQRTSPLTQIPTQWPPTSSTNGKSTNGSTSASHIPTIKYPKGTVLRTYARHHPRQGDITIEEVLQKDYLNTAIISAFTFNLAWLFGKLNTKRTKLILVMGAKGETEKQQWTREAEEVGRGSIKVVWPPMEGEASLMHSKLMLLRYDQSLRIVVTSANVEQYDWGETGVMENSVFLIDLPELQENKTQKMDNLTFFGKELLYFMRRSNFDDKVLDKLLKFDFAATEGIGFVYSW